MSKKKYQWSEERKKAFSLKWSGENSPSWRGGLTLDKEYQKAQKKRWFQSNPERAKFLSERSHNKDRDRYLLLKRLWQKNNYERSLENNKKYRLAHPDRVRRWRKTDWERNKEKILFRNRQRELRERNAIGKVTFEEWSGLKAEYGFRCVSCKKVEPDVKLTQDHIVPLVKGGSNSIDNIQPLCGPCNSSKNDTYINYLYG